MPGPHLTLTLWHCFPDVGGCDAWLSSWWGEPNENHSWQWFTGWHSPNALADWEWPGATWTLIGHERWEYLNGASFKSAAQYAHPNPSTTPRGWNLRPRGHWSLLYAVDGTVQMSTWSDDILQDGALYLKGGKGNGKGNGDGKCGDDPKGKGKGKGYAKGNDEDFPKGKGKGKGYAKGNDEDFPKGKNKGAGDDFPKGKGEGNHPKGKSQSKGQKGNDQDGL